MRQGFFLGAGASYELGMPLVVELTHTLKSSLGPSTLRQIRALNSFPPGWSAIAIEEWINLLEQPNLHYEAVIGALEVQGQRKNEHSDTYNNIRADIVSSVSYLLAEQHRQSYTRIVIGMKYVTGFAEYLKNNAPLNIFTLNHDLIIEEICSSLSSPLKAGFFENDEYVKSALIGASLPFNFDTVTASQIEIEQLDFFKPGQPGVNLWKLHGSLDTFLFNNCNDFVRFRPKNLNVGDHLLMLSDLEDTSRRTQSEYGTIASQMLTISDSKKILQFFDRSLITGAFKFRNKPNHRKALNVLFNNFKTKIYEIDELICIGYGFGDLHVNEALERWLCESRTKKLTIVDPFIKQTPSFLLHLTNQVELINKTFLEFITPPQNITEELNLFMFQQQREFDRIQRSRMKIG
ncbi:MAG: hypothetical protein ABWY06_20125 [Pseudomonas sp.]|uniref:hypothetical protein n=1 Tax=Pseudomonas sp. TaxID=306 RepID=UPI003395277F